MSSRACVTDMSKREIGDDGEKNGFSFVLDTGGIYYVYTRYLRNITGLSSRGDHKRVFDIMITPPDVFSVSRQAEASVFTYEMQPRWSVKVKVDYMEEGTDEFKAMPPERRRCFYPQEKTLRHFEVYSESNCMLQCAWEDAVEACSCVPWFLYEKFPNVHMCEAFGNRCFRSVLDARYETKEDSSRACFLECLPDCESVHYSVEPGYSMPTDDDSV